MATPAAAVIGTGFIGPVHVEGLLRAGVRVAGILGSTPEKSRRAAEQLNLPRAYESLEELLADDEVGVVHVASPNRRHFEQASRALRAGKHVLCEKPLAMNSAESAELVALAREAGLAAGVNYNIRYYPLCLEAAERVRGGEVGGLFHVTGSYVQDWLLLENCYLTDAHKIRLCEICGELDADWVKTSTGYGTGGATHDDLRLMREHSPAHVQVKAAGGVRDLDALLAVRSLGVTRCGASRTAEMLGECRRRLGMPATTSGGGGVSGY